LHPFLTHTLTTKMKKLLFLSVAALMTAIVACGPSAEEQAKEQARIDSLRQDSIMQVEAAAQKAMEDSLAAAAAAAMDTTAAPATEAAPATK